MPAMQHVIRHGGKATLHRGNARADVRSQKQQKAAVHTTGFYNMSLNQGAVSALATFTVLMAIFAAVQPAHAGRSDYICDHNPSACNGVGSQSLPSSKDAFGKDHGGWRY